MNWFDLHKQFHEERKADPIFLKEYIDKWMLSDLPKVVDSILSREEYQGDGPLLPVSWMDFGHLGFVLGKNQGLVPFVYSQSWPTLLSQPLIEEELFYHFELSQFILILLAIFFSSKIGLTKYYLQILLPVVATYW